MREIVPASGNQVQSAGAATGAARLDPGGETPFAAMRGGDGLPVTVSGPATFVAMVAFDRFKELRRRIGYRSATLLIDELCHRVRAMLPSASIGRTGRTSFEFFFRCEDAAAATAELERLCAGLAKPLHIDGIPVTLSPTIGATELGRDGVTDRALDAAALALEEAQRRHRSVGLVRETDESAEHRDDLALLKDIGDAMASGDLHLLYQPKLRTRTNTVDSAEALLRWQHPRRGAVPVEPFIRLAEETGAIRGLTEWVLRTAVADQRVAADRGHVVTLWVNISGQLLPDSDFAASALAIVASAGGRIGFEITETAVIGDPVRALANVAAFAAAGIKIAIDDYGSGLSSLSYLKQLPAQELKIDRLFIKDLIDSHRDPLLVRSSIELAHALEMEVTAEGVDNPMTLALLRVMGCDLIQGYLIAPPLSLDALLALLSDPDRLLGLASPAVGSRWPMRTTRDVNHG